MSIVFIGGVTIAMISYSPFFISTRDIIVTSAMTSLNHQYIVKFFFDEKTIEAIMNKNKVNEPKANSNIQTVKKALDEKKKKEAAIEKIKNEAQQKTYLSQIQSINITGNNYVGHLLIINDPSKVSVRHSSNLGNTGEKLKNVLSLDKTLIGGVNGGGFNDDQSSGGVPWGCIIENYKLIYGNNSTVYNLIGFNKDNVLVLGKYTIPETQKLEIRDAVSFKPFLIVNGESMITSGNGGWGIAPRTVIGQTKDGKVLLLTIDGRQIGYSIGATLKNVQDIMVKYGAYNAANLDGGSSTVMYYKNQLMNRPCGGAGERKLPSVFVISSK